jgi:PAS domain S-box-containing protein
MAEDRYRRLFESAQEIIWAHRDDKIVIANPFAASFVGARSSEELIGKSMLSFIHPDDRAHVLERRRQALRADGMLPPTELRIRRGDGSFATVEFRAQRFEDAGGTAVLGIGRDVSDRVTAQATARESQRLLGSFMEHAPFAMFVKDRKGRYLLMNQEGRRAAGVLDRDIRGMRDADYLSAEFAARIEAHDRSIMESDAPETTEGPSAFGYSWSLATKFPIHDNSGAIVGVGGFEIDMSERRRLEEQLERGVRLEAIGKLTGGIAHDFNNLLTVVFGNLERALEAGSDVATVRTAVTSALAAAERGAELTSRLLAFARRQPLAPTSFDLNERVESMHDMLQRTLGETIDLRCHLAPDLKPAHADPSQVESALLNLALNARDAMPDGGRLTVETANARLDELSFAAGEEVASGDYVMLAVSDTGTGMSPEVLRRAVEPFFTTKEVGRGSGLGLSMIYGFARQSGGYLKLYSEPGRGTTVRLYLPTAGRRPAAAADAEGPAEATLPRGRETILVVEDDEQVRRVVVANLAGLGYRVLEAGDGPAALEILAHEPAVDLLFTDVVMPKDMSGQALAERAQRERPQLKVLFTTGYTQDAIVHAGRLDRGVMLLPKPYSRATLARRIRDALEG